MSKIFGGKHESVNTFTNCFDLYTNIIFEGSNVHMYVPGRFVESTGLGHLA